jgi:hypothetical protein
MYWGLPKQRRKLITFLVEYLILSIFQFPDNDKSHNPFLIELDLSDESGN